MTNRVAGLLALGLVMSGCRQIWYYQPAGAHSEVEDGYRYWIGLGEIDLGTWAPFVVGPWRPGDESTLVGFRIQNRTAAEVRIQRIHVRVNDVAISPFMVVEDKKNGFKVPPLGASEYSVWIEFPDQIADVPRGFVLMFEVVTPEGVRPKEVAFSN